MWTAATREQHKRTTERYPSDLTDAEWEVLRPHLPPPRKARRFPVHPQREIVNGLLYVLTTGCQWRAVPSDLPPKSTLHDYFVEWHSDGTLTRLHHALYARVREAEGREPTATTAIVDSQSVKSAEKGGRASIRPGTMQPRKSRERSVMRPSTPSVSSSAS
jgi:transposase